jgi:release factor glutamine methyltransferase
MLTVLESIKLSTEYLEKKGIESPRINAELLLAHILNCKRLDLYLTYDRPLSDEEIALYRLYLKRRGEYEPLQYIVGSVEFYGLPFYVNSSVLIPRQETEVLVEEILNNYKDREKISILEIGTGSGNIAVALARNLPGVLILATDVSNDALEIARKNSVLNRTENQIKFIQSNILDDSQVGKDFDVIVSNPPYVSMKEFEKLEPELRIYEPRVALTDDADGLIYYRAISLKAKDLLRPTGRLYFEIGAGQSEKVKNILTQNGFSSIQIRNDYLNIKRVISGELS